MLIGETIREFELTGSNIEQKLQTAVKRKNGASVFAYYVNDPERYGVIEFDDHGRAISLEEKPQKPKSKFAIPGLYFCDDQAAAIAKSLEPKEF